MGALTVNIDIGGGFGDGGRKAHSVAREVVLLFFLGDDPTLKDFAGVEEYLVNRDPKKFLQWRGHLSSGGLSRGLIILLDRGVVVLIGG